MNVYDFDNTVFFPDSSYSFVMYCLRHYPRAVLPALPKAGAAAVRRLLGQCSMKEVKEKVFSFLSNLDDPERIAEEFWEERQFQVSDWYQAQKRPDDVIVSASPEFLLRPIAENLGVSLIATRMDTGSGRIVGENCHDSEKVCRFLKAYPGGTVDAFYSDSLSDSPMAWFAGTAWLVRNESERVPWPNK